MRLSLGQSFPPHPIMEVNVQHTATVFDNYGCKANLIDKVYDDMDNSNHHFSMLSSPDPSFPSPPASPGPLISTPISSTDSLLNLLPMELLILIFSFCIDDDPDVPPILAGVCQQWRAIVLDLPVLWSRLKLSDRNFNAKHLRAKTELWESRRASSSVPSLEPSELPVDVELDTQYRDSILPLLSYIVPSLDRWNTVSYLYSRMRFLLSKDNEKACLETLLVTLTPKRSLEKGDLLINPPQPPSSRTWWGGRDYPVSKDFAKSRKEGEYLKEAYVLGVRRLPSPDILKPFNTVTTLILMNSSTECDFPMHQVVPFLSAFPALESIEMANFNELFHVHDPEYREDCHLIRSAELPYLKRMSIRGICSSRCVLSHLYAPCLESLVIVHINNSQTYDHPLPGEPGDSDDEAHDFSRSPWTDHATGMGLRRLFAPRKGENTEPVLRELIMDYADLRTKDFKWLFSRLTNLEKFYIVASDMSDNVVRALAVDVDISTGALPSHPVLPKLTRLKLTKCQKVSGAALMRMVASRIAAAAHGRIAQFEELGIMECVGVTSFHHHELQTVFPDNSILSYAPGAEE